MKELKERLYRLLKEKLSRAGKGAATPPVMISQVFVEWPELRTLSNEGVEKKIRSLRHEDMLELYKKLEKDVGLRVDPENYKPAVIVKNFMLLWIRKIDDERRAKANFEKHGEKLVPLTGDEVDRIFSNRSRSSRIAPLSDREDDDF